MKTFTHKTLYLTMLSLFASYSGATLAQEPPSDEDMETISITGVKDLNSLIPIESKSAFGLDKSLVETPRSVTDISSDLIEAYGLRSVDDLVRITPGAFTSSFFGIQGAMDIRGESADNYFRGFRRIANPGAFKTNIRGAKGLEVMRGPVSPLYGNGSVGGQLNYSPKSAKSDATKYFDEATGEIHLTLGTYDQKILAVEGGTPFMLGDKQAGVYIFAEAEDSGSYYDNYEPTNEIVQVALDVDLTDKTLMEFGFQYQTSDAIQVPGWNRVTQDLIDNGTYITGAPVAKNSDNPIGADRLLPQESGFISPFAPYFINSSFSGVGTFCSPGTADNSNYTYNAMLLSCPGVADGIENAYALSNPGTAQIDHKTTFIDDIDFADSTAFTAYLDFTNYLSDDMTWKNQFYYDYMDHTKFQSWGFTADYPGAEAMEFRSSLNFETFHDNATIQHITGISIRNEDLDYNHAYYDETFDFRDIIVGPTPDDRIDWAVDDPYEDATIIYDEDGNPTGIDGTVRRNYNEEQVSTMLNAGLFYIADITLESWSILLGARYDYFDVESEDQAISLLGIPFGDGEVHTDTESAFSYNVSVSYKMESGFVPYATYAESSSLSTNQLGGIIPSSVDNGEYLAESTLAELGIKYSSDDESLYAALAVFDQEKTDRIGQTSALVAVYSEGVEFEARAILNESFSLTATATHIETTEVSDGALAVINGADFAAQNGLEAYQVYGGRIAGNRSTFVGEGVELDRGGLPDNTMSLFLNYNKPLERGRVTASLGFGWADETYTDVLETILLPSYMVWTGSVGYVAENYRILLSVNNLFEEEYYTSADLFDSVVVKPSEGRTGSIMFSYSF
ncbi:TonB-dependent siderophore receptor [Alteromonas stellipolaris]|uniref:TonB-dependent siderophore receptor n=1 Tax=Alteromonas stellipolaris TaxID=233316 RepID=UPI002735C550|nr:TonB-dependent receptor plug domain-containing protein [Alteromonas stellipolaris]MDP2595699.1 TonB-dependent receptor [Alteromonas stellipolaris]